MGKNDMLGSVALWLCIIGALNWGLGLFNVNLVTLIFGSFADWVYGVVSLAAIYKIYEQFA